MSKRRLAPRHHRRRPIRCESLESRLLLAVTPVVFQHFTIDGNPGVDPDEKLLLDVDGDGKEDAVVGFSNFIAGSKGGIYWYQFPHSGNPADHWNRYTIAGDGEHAYEDMTAYDVNGDGVKDIIASYNNSIVWFDNPRGHGGDPRTDTWVRHLVGPDQEHEMVLGDFDGDGKIDIASTLHIYFQNSPTSWTTVSAPQYNRAERGVWTFDSGAGLGSVDLVGIAPSPYPMVWFENPRDHGGNARTDVWTPHYIADSYKASDPNVAVAFQTEDVNGDGRMDVITCYCESTDNSSHPGGLEWFEAPVNRATGTWIKHVIDNNIQDTHRLRLADMNGDGIPDIVFSEQEQSVQDRVGIYYQTDKTGNNWQLQILSFQSGHNHDVGDIDGDGDIDILSAPHGVYEHVNPIEIYMSQLKNGVSSTVPPGWTDEDIGAPAMPGSAQTSDGVNWVVTGGGADIFNSSDQFNFASRNVGGPTTIIAKITQLTLTDPSSKAGVMLRASDDPASAYADVVAMPGADAISTPGSGVAFEWRSAAGAAAQDAHVLNIPGTPQWVKLVRSGNSFSGFYSSDGVAWTQIGATQTISMAPTALGGLVATARNNAMLNTGVFTNVSVMASDPLAAADSIVTKANQPSVIDVLANDLPGASPLNPATVTISTPPNHGQTSVDHVTGKVTYTPGGGLNVADSFQYTVQDNAGKTTNAATVSLTANANQPPIARYDPVLTKTNTPLSIPVLANDYDPDGQIDPTTVAIVVKPQSGTVVVDSATGVVTYTPNKGFNGNDLFEYTVKDDSGDRSNPGIVVIGVSPNQNPTAGDDTQTTSANQAVDVNVLGNDSDVDGTIDPTTVAISTSPKHGQTVVNKVTGVVTYTPGANYAGSDDFYYTVKDNNGGQSAPAHVTLTINRISAPVYLSDLTWMSATNGWGPPEKDESNGDTAAGDGHTITLNGVTYAKGLGVHAQSDISYNIPAGAQWFLSDIGIDDEVGANGNVIFQVYLDGSLAYDSGAMTGASATKTVQLSIAGKSTLRLLVLTNGANTSDHADWAGARLSFDPAPPANVPPVAGNDSATTSKNTAVKINVLANDSDSDGSINPSTVLITQQPASGSAVVNSDGTITYTPNANYSGGDSFMYTVKDNLGVASNAATVNLTVNNVVSTYLSDLSWTSATNGWGSVEKDMSNGEKASGDGHAMTLNSVTYAKGLGVNSTSDISYNIGSKYSQFTTDLGIDDEVGNNGSVHFQIWLDGTMVYDSGLMTGASATKSIMLNVTGKSTLRLLVTNGGDNTSYDHADWAGARLMS